MSLKIDNLSFSYGKKTVLQNINLEIHQGELIAVLGPNGVGKSTLFRCMLGILSDYRGSITAGGDDIKVLSRKELSKRIAYIPQAHRPTFGYTVLETVLMGTTRYLSPFQQPGQEHITYAMDALKKVGMENLAENSFTKLSGGQQQLVLIARALAQNAEILIMDEPASALDFGNQMKLLRLLKELSKKGYCVVFSTHNPQHGISFADKVLALGPNCIYTFDETKDVINAEMMKTLYGVDVDFVRHGEDVLIVPVAAEKSMPNWED